MKRGKKYYETKSDTKKTGCLACIKLQIKNGIIQMEYYFHHNHSFIDYHDTVKATVCDPVCSWLIKQALEGRDWKWVNQQRSKVNFGTNVTSFDQSLKFNCQLYHRIRHRMGRITGKFSAYLEESLKGYQQLLSKNGYVNFWENLNNNENNEQPKTWGFAFSTNYMLTKLKKIWRHGFYGCNA